MAMCIALTHIESTLGEMKRYKSLWIGLAYEETGKTKHIADSFDNARIFI